MSPDTAARELPLTRRLKNEFDRETRRAGEAIAAEGRVTLAYVGRHEILATVRGTRLHEVSLNPSGPLFDLFCSCPHFDDGRPCKHLWAVAVKVDERDGAPPPAATRVFKPKKERVRTRWTEPPPEPVEPPHDPRLADVRVPPLPIVTVTTRRRDFDRRPANRLAATVLFDYLGLLVRTADPRPKIVDAPRHRVIHRDPAHERKRLDELAQAGFVNQPGSRGYADIDFELDAVRLPRAVPPLLAAGWRVEADGHRYVVPGKSRVEVKSGVAWFDLKGGVEFDG